MTAPLTTVNYRIQNVDFLSYLELPGFTTNIQMRPFKANNLNQQWKFVDAGSGTFWLASIASPNQYLGYSSGYLGSVAKSSAWNWTLVSDAGSYFIYFASGSTRYCFQTDTSSVVTLSTTKTMSDNQRWRLVPVTPASPDRLLLLMGYYRIRTFNGLHLMTMLSGEAAEDASMFVKTQTLSDAYQRWLVTRQTNSFYLIQSAGPATSTHLGCSSGQSAIGDHLLGLSTAFEWDLRQIGQGLAWSINLPQSPTALSLRFADYEAADDENISLEPTDTAPSQIWFFETYIPLGKDTIHAKRQVNEGNYRLQSCHDNTIYMNVASTPYRITAGSATTKVFGLKYNNGSPELTLSYATSTGNVPVADCGGFLGFTNNATVWVLLSENKDDPGMYLCRSNAGYPRKVVSSRITVDINENKVFAINNMATGETMQMWKLVKVD
ncbi:hypothetical protein Hypma_012072 [Hypsizygus marmoreus]|uniref:Uncharacterized protein n=1 Tax=Hypsizygus marmoreus TaxID=39966 RepID=A0A369JN85_HYPMA|nr:hypothetical protein Hypma_012072 [Hypsizygus marmoreus]